MRLANIYKKSSNKDNLKVRFKDWNYKIKYFQITEMDEKKNRFVGLLDSGEKAVFPMNSDHWEIYFEGLENQAKAK